LRKDGHNVKEEALPSPDTSIIFHIYLFMPLPGLSAITSLRLVAKVYDVRLDEGVFISRLPELFTGLGK